jgi:hypothetical protein
VDLDVEEQISRQHIEHLIIRLKMDLGLEFIITLAPVYWPMVNDHPTKRQVGESMMGMEGGVGIDAVASTPTIPSSISTTIKASPTVKAEDLMIMVSKRNATSQEMKNQPAKYEPALQTEDDVDDPDSFSSQDTCPAPPFKINHENREPTSQYADICTRKRANMYHPNGTIKRNLSGFNYADLRKSDAGSLVNWYNVQCYCGWGTASANSLHEIVQNGWLPSQIVIGTVTNAGACAGYVELRKMGREIREMARMYPDFGGIVGWEYFNGNGKFDDNPSGSNINWPVNIGRFIDQGLRWQ